MAFIKSRNHVSLIVLKFSTLVILRKFQVLTFGVSNVSSKVLNSVTLSGVSRIGRFPVFMNHTSVKSLCRCSSRQKIDDMFADRLNFLL